MAKNKWVTGVKFHPYKWSFFTLLITGDGAHFLSFDQRSKDPLTFCHPRSSRISFPRISPWGSRQSAKLLLLGGGTREQQGIREGFTACIASWGFSFPKPGNSPFFSQQWTFHARFLLQKSLSPWSEDMNIPSLWNVVCIFFIASSRH